MSEYTNLVFHNHIMPHDMKYRFRDDGLAEVSTPGLKFSFEKDGTTYTYEPADDEYYFIMNEHETLELRLQLEAQQVDPSLMITMHHVYTMMAFHMPTEENINAFIERVVNYYGLLVR